MAFVILCDRCGAIIRPGKSSYASVSCTMNGKMDAFLICESCYNDLTHWITGNEMEDEVSECTREAIDIAINATKKQIPKKPNDKFNVPDYVLAYGICPSCNRGVNSDMKFCSECGQAIDWSENE